MNFRRLAVAAVVLIGAVSASRAQPPFAYNPQAEQEFAGAVRLFKGGQFADALPLFDSLSRIEPVHQRTTAAYIMAGKTLFELKNFRESAITLVKFLKTYPQTTYGDDARYTLGLDYLMLQWYDDAALQFLRTVEMTDDPRLASKASSLFEGVADEHLNIQSMQFLLPKLTKTDTKETAELMLARKYLAAGRPEQAQEVLGQILGRGTTSETEKRAAALRSGLINSSMLRIGVMLPLMSKSPPGPVKSVAEEMLDGMTCAISEFKRRNPSARLVAMEVRDTGRDSVTAISEIRELSGSPEVIGVIGPLFSNIAMGCAPIANASALPLVTPTATAGGIASRGPFVFQLNPDFEMRGKIMARYAVQQLGLKTFAVLAPDEPMGKEMADSFSREAVLLGAEVVASVTYAKGAGDLHDQFGVIRSAGFKLAGEKDQTDKTEVPVSSIEGLFAPVSDPEEIGVISSQVAYFNVKTQILGAGEWYDPGQLDVHKRYVNGVIFTADNYYDRDDSAYRRLEAEIANELGKRPTRYSVLGYDAMALLLTQVGQGATTRSELAAALSSVKNYRGLHGLVSFSPGRVNSAMTVLQYKNGEIRKLTDLSLY